jgi:hypothetical protein
MTGAWRARSPATALLLTVGAISALSSPCSSSAAACPFRELGLRRGHATPQQVRAAYLRLARELHPDKNRKDWAHGADKAERFKRVQRAYEEITACAGEPAADGACQAKSCASTARRAGSAPEQPPVGAHDGAPQAAGQSVGIVGGCGAYDMRVFTDSVELEDMHEDPDEAGFVLTCRCGGSFLLPRERVAEENNGGVAVNCQLCSLWIWVGRKDGEGQTGDEWR